MSRLFGWCGSVVALGLPLFVTGCVSLLPRGETVADANQPASRKGSDLPTGHAVELSLTLADNLEKTGHLVEAAGQLERARATDPKLNVSHRLAILYDRVGELARAEAEYQRALGERPKDANLLNDLGYCYYNQGNWPEAEKHLRLALEVQGNHQRAWINLGLTLGMQERYADSFEAFQKVVAPADAHCNLGFILTAQGKRDEAKDAYRRALELDPNKKLAQAALAKLEEAERKPQGDAKAALATTPALPAKGGASWELKPVADNPAAPK